MGVGVFAGIGAVLFGGMSGVLLGKGVAYSVLRRKRSASMVSSDMRKWVSARIGEGCRPFKPAARWLLGLKKLGNTVSVSASALESMGIKTDAQSFLSVLIAMGLAVGIIGSVLTGSVVFGAAIAAIAVIAVFGAIKSKTDKRNAAIREGIPEALRCMEACFRSGQSLLQTLGHTSKEIGGPLGNVFAVSADRLELGEPMSQALAVMRDNPDVPELSFIAVALGVQHQSGGSIAPVLESARDSVESELELMRSLRVQTAQAKLSASIVTVMPFILVALFSLMSSDFLAPFFSSLLGMILLAVALTMQIAGVLMVRRMLKIDVG